MQKLGGKFVPTEIGLVVTDLLVENFRDIFDVQYTARLEEELDEIEEGKEGWTDALAGFYKKFEKDLRYAHKHMENIKRMEKPTDEKCERCGSPLVIKWGKHGSFYACSSYDKEDPNSCTFTKENPINLPDLDTADVQETTQEEYCENCGRVMVPGRGRALVSSWPARVIQIARRRGDWIKESECRILRSRNFAPSARGIW